MSFNKDDPTGNPFNPIQNMLRHWKELELQLWLKSTERHVKQRRQVWSAQTATMQIKKYGTDGWVRLAISLSPFLDDRWTIER